MAGDIRAEIEELKKKLSQNPDSLIFVPLADTYRKAGQLEEAVDVCKAGLEKHPSYASARVVLGRIYSEKNMLDEAIEEFKRVESVDVDNIMVHSMLGNVYLKKKMYAEAVEQFQKVLSLNPEDAEIQEKLQDALSAKQSPPAKEEKPAVQAVKQAHEAKKEAAPAPPQAKTDTAKSMKAGELYTKKEEFDKAIDIYKEVLDADPDNIIAQQRLREVYTLQDKKRSKEKEKRSDGKRIDAEKITTEDILDVMKEAVEDDKVEEEAAAKAAEKKKESVPAKAEEKKEEKKELPKEAITAEKAKALEKILKDLGEVDGVVGSFFLTRDGKIVASVLPSTINAAGIEKHIATIVERTEKSVQSMDQGKLNQVVISSESGQLLFTEVLSGVLFMIGNESINVGKMRLILKDVIDNIKKVL